MDVFSAFSAFTLFVLCMVVISNQVNVVVSASQNGTTVEQMLTAEMLFQQIARDQAQPQNLMFNHAFCWNCFIKMYLHDYDM